MSSKEKYSVFTLLALSLFFGIASLWNIYIAKTDKIPSYGNTYSEALIGGPQFINPILMISNDVDRDISELIYSGIMEYAPNGDIVPGLAKSYAISENGKEYTFYLKDNILWHDGKKFTSDDVVFTISAIINPAYLSPLRPSWQGIKVEKIDDYTVKFTLNNTYAPFLEKTTLGIIPKHIWDPVDPKNIILANANLNPIGTGPYKTKKIVKNKEGQIKSFYLEANGNYYKKRPYIDKVIFYFYDDEEQAINAYQKGDVLGVASASPKNKYLIFNDSTKIHNFKIPKYFSIFFNQNQSIVLSDQKVRQALAHAIDKEALNKGIFLGETTIIDSPILPNLREYNDELKKYEYNIEKAKELLASSGWKDTDNNGILEKIVEKGKDPIDLEITIATSDFIDLVKTSEMIKEQWTKIGVKVIVENYGIEDLKQNVIKTRKYDSLIFGEVLSHYPDPFAFWHSSQKKDPGLNLALYSNKDVDKLLEEARQSLDEKTRIEKLKKFQEIISDELPAIFLYSPHYLYPVNKKVNGITAENIILPSKRFIGIENWYINTQRVSKSK
ncbi:MAG: ABC transporter substrate-binding protein [Patescibacteria group bacterium]